ncbi:hypothetical protein ACLX1H_005547 [Fusarium chlamydosporum]
MPTPKSTSPGTWPRTRDIPGQRVVEDPSAGELRIYTVAALAGYRNFSTEEHRLQDDNEMNIMSAAGPSQQQFTKVTSTELPKSGRLAL